MTKLKEKFFVTEGLNTFCTIVCAIFGLLLYVSIVFALLRQLVSIFDVELFNVPNFVPNLISGVMSVLFIIIIPCAQLCLFFYVPLILMAAVLIWATINSQNEKNAFAIINPTVLGTCVLVAVSSAVLTTVATSCF